jgi:pimeloyl-ACP methyl ester carboxylesterase
MLAERYRVIALDWFGWGNSQRSLALRPRYDEEVNRLTRVMDALDLPTVNLFAHDYGGYIGLGWVLAKPERVRRFAILNSRAHRTFSPAFYWQTALYCFMARWPVLRSLLARLPAGSYHRRALRKYVESGCFTDQLVEAYVGWMDSLEGRRWLAHFYAHYEPQPRPLLAAGLPYISCPTAVIWGDTDPYCPFSTGQELAATVPGAQLTRIEGAGHFVMEERPYAVLEALERLMARESKLPLATVTSTRARG